MKRGDYVPPVGSATVQVRDANLLVDFDRKWAETGRSDGFMSSDEESDSADADERVEYEDEFGRQRQGTRAEARREERRRAAQAHAAETLEELSARPAPPPQLIRGDVIQSAAFNPDAQIAAQMEEMARRRDRSLTPPPVSHYDANSEIRSKGVGFYAFSREEGERRREMDSLKRERQETERKRAAQPEPSGADEVRHADESKPKSGTSNSVDSDLDQDPDPSPHPLRQNNDETIPSNTAENTKIPEKNQDQDQEDEIKHPSNSHFATPRKPHFRAQVKSEEEEEEKGEMDLASRFLDSLD